MITVRTALALALLSTFARAQKGLDAVEIDGIVINLGNTADSEDAVKWKVLSARKGIHSYKELHESARDNLKREDRLPFHFQRVEVAGAGSTDNTNETMPDMIDKQLKLSHANDVPSERWLDKLKNFFDRGKDLTESLSDTSGTPTARSQKILAELKGKRINELFAHSWGSEAVYLGILNGDILPPKKLVIIGVPASNEQKWLMLAKYTGIEVHVIGFENDKARAVGRAGLMFKSELPTDTAGLESLWRERCAEPGHVCANPAKFKRTKFDYNIDAPLPREMNSTFIDRKLSHDRLIYYSYLYSRKLFNKTIEELDAPQAKMVEDESNRILEEAMDEARSLIASAKIQAQIYASERSKGFWGKGNMDEFRRRMSEIRKNEVPPVVRPIAPRIAPAVPAGKTFFSSNLSDLKDLAVRACSSSNEVAPAESLVNPQHSYFFSKDRDDQIIAELSVHLDSCSRQLFSKLIEMIRAGQGPSVTSQWLRTRANDYTSRPIYVDPPMTPPRRGGRCEDYGNIRCP